jgi:MFS family permease
MGYATSFEQLYFLRGAMGLSEALYIPAGLSLIADYHQSKSRSLAIGLHMTGLYVGQALGGFGATIASNYSWQATFHYFGIAGIIYSGVLMLGLRDYKAKDNPSPEEAHVEQPGSHSVMSSLSILFGTISFWVLLFYFAAPSFPGWAIKNWIPTLFNVSLDIEMAIAGPLSSITIAVSSLVGVLIGGTLSDRWVQANLKGRIYTSAIGLSLTIPALLFLGFGSGMFAVLSGAILFGVGFGMFDANNMPILCQFVAPRHRAAGYGLMNMTGVFAGAFITDLLGKSTDSGQLGHDIAYLAIPVTLAVALLIFSIKPKVNNFVG